MLSLPVGICVWWFEKTWTLVLDLFPFWPSSIWLERSGWHVRRSLVVSPNPHIRHLRNKTSIPLTWLNWSVLISIPSSVSGCGVVSRPLWLRIWVNQIALFLIWILLSILLSSGFLEFPLLTLLDMVGIAFIIELHLLLIDLDLWPGFLGVNLLGVHWSFSFFTRLRLIIGFWKKALV